MLHRHVRERCAVYTGLKFVVTYVQGTGVSSTVSSEIKDFLQKLCSCDLATSRSKSMCMFMQVLLVGARDFTVVGRPVLRLVSVKHL